MTDPVLSGLRERIERYRATGDRNAIMGRTVELELVALLGPNEGFDAEAAAVGGMVHWLRYRAGSTSDEDLTEAVRLFALLRDNGSEHEIPGSIELILACRRGG